MLFVVVALRQQPKFVPAVVEPLVLRWWDVLSRELWIDEKISMPVEANLQQASTILRQND